MIGYMGNNVLPLRAGEFVRIYVVARRLAAQRGGSVASGLWLAGATVVIERVLDSLTLVLILGVLILLIPVPPALEYAAAIILAVDAVAAAVLTTLALAPRMLRGGSSPGSRAVDRRSQRRAERALDLILRGLEGIRAPAHRLPLLGWTVVAWALSATGAWALLRAMHLSLPFVAGWTVMTFVGFGISIPSAPGYVGVWHAATVLALSIFGVAPGDCARLRIALPCQSVRPDHADRVAVPGA